MKQQQQQQRRRQQQQPQDVASIVQQNDYAAGCIEGGRYDEAIGNLLHALKLSDLIDDGHDDDDHDDNCCRDASRCKKNIMETCMSYGESLLSPKHHNKKRRRSSSVVVPKKDATTTTADEESFIYSTPIRAQPTLSIQKDHRLGIVLQLIIIFNLALAYHLRAIQQLVSHDSLRQVLQLYEVAYRLQVREDIRSLRFTMVLANNLGQVHRAAGNGSKYAMCLEHVLSAMMFLLDVQQQQSDQSSRGLFDLDGFARNTSKLILQDQCAAAA